MMQATYHKRKLYVPEEVAKKLRLKDGDKVEYAVRGEDTASLRIVRKESSRDLLLEELSNPGALGVKKSSLRRKKIYEDIN